MVDFVITRIKRIRNLGLFTKFDWSDDLEDFRRFNLIYGWNGCGKTTLSKLFAALELGRSPEFDDLEYEVVTASRSWKQVESCTEMIRVFNRDYVVANVESIGGPNAIFILGEENKQLSDQIESDQEELSRRSSALAVTKTEIQRLRDRRGEIFTDVARTISQNVSGESTRNYRRPNAETDFQKITEKSILEEDALMACRATIGQKQLGSLPKLLVPPNFDSQLREIEIEVKKILGTVISAVPIQRLTENQDIADWVEKGVEIHQKHESETCEYCANKISPDRTAELEAHFNAADAKLKGEITDQISVVNDRMETVRNLKVRESSNLYDELQAGYETTAAELVEAQSELLAQLEVVVDLLKEKRTKTGKKVEMSSAIDDAGLLDALKKTNAAIDVHNAKTSEFEGEKDEARSALKQHYLSEIVDDVKSIDAKIVDQVSVAKKIEEGDVSKGEDVGLAALRSRITENKAVISSSHKACAELNDKLARFLGRDEIAFEVSGDGYVIKRHGTIAKSLSEGEKTAIAFVYFIVQLSDQDFDLSKGIVVIDDPVSSLDSNSLFQAFAFLKESVAGAKQVFVLTHNFEFMRLVKNWFFHVKKVGGVKQQSFYMIKNRQDGNLRTAYLAALDRLLMEYESEYHYLFSLLIDFSEDGMLESIYLFPNIGRKVLETFLAFKVPTLENMDEKMKHLDFPEMEKSAIIRFVNTHSHANRGDGVIGFDLSLTNGGQQAILSLLSLIEKVDVTHYESMVKTCGKAV